MQILSHALDTCFRQRKPWWNVRHPWYWLSIYKQSFSRLAFAVAIGHKMRNTTTAAQFRDDISWLTIHVMSNFMAVLTDTYCRQIVQCPIIADNCINNNNVVATKVYWWIKNNPKASDIYIYIYKHLNWQCFRYDFMQKFRFAKDVDVYSTNVLLLEI